MTPALGCWYGMLPQKVPEHLCEHLSGSLSENLLGKLSRKLLLNLLLNPAMQTVQHLLLLRLQNKTQERHCLCPCLQHPPRLSQQRFQRRRSAASLAGILRQQATGCCDACQLSLDCLKLSQDSCQMNALSLGLFVFLQLKKRSAKWPRWQICLNSTSLTPPST